MTTNLSTNQVAARFGLTRARIIQLINAGHIQAVKFGPVFLIPEDTLPSEPTWPTKPGPKKTHVKPQL